jgi:SMODS-associated NUDIX domain
MKYVLQIIAAIIFIIIGKSFASDELRPEFVGNGLILLLTLIIVELGYDIYKNWKRIKLVTHCFYLSLLGQSIRFSMSYQYRIKIQDKYLLVKNSNWNHYQFVGGKYKRLKQTQGFLQSEFEARDDFKLQTSGLMKDDFALFIPAKNAIKFIDWFNKGKGREISHWREFYEELIEGKAKVLSQQNFPYVNYNFIGTVTTPIKRTPGWDCFEILQYDVLELIPNASQEKELELLMNKGDTEYIKWADEELIKCLGHDNRQKKTLYKIGEHAKWALNLRWSKD